MGAYLDTTSLVSALDMDSSVFASALGSEVRRVCIFGFLVETLSPSLNLCLS